MKKLICILLVVVLLTGLLAGCCPVQESEYQHDAGVMIMEAGVTLWFLTEIGAYVVGSTVEQLLLGAGRLNMWRYPR
jgi:hypothetical protein